jgi:hypothetical protein
MLEASMVAFVVGSFFLNRAQFDLFYHFLAIVIVFGVIARQTMADMLTHPERTSDRGTLTLAREGGFSPQARPSGFERAHAPGGLARRPSFRSR